MAKARSQTYDKEWIRDTLKEMGLWKEWIVRREVHRKEGVKPSQIWDVMVEEYAEILWPNGMEESTMATEHQPEAPANPELTPPILSDVDPLDPGEMDPKNASHRENVEWVAANLGITTPDQSTAPSTTAWGMLMWARSSKTNTSEFWRMIYTKLMPTKADIDKQNRMSDDGTDITSSIDDLLQMNASAQSDD